LLSCLKLFANLNIVERYNSIRKETEEKGSRIYHSTLVEDKSRIKLMPTKTMI